MSYNRNAKLIGLFMLMVLLFNFPILPLFGKQQLIFGLPVLYVYIFVVWLAIIVAVYFIFHKPK